MNNDSLGDRIKGYENLTNNRLMNYLPVIARIDGKTFHTFTKGLRRPYDVTLSNLMIHTTKFLVEYFDAKVGYTQSDEISLLFQQETLHSELVFGGRIQKLCSVLASATAAKFNKDNTVKPDTLAMFDCRVFNVPNSTEVLNYFVWRQQDAVRNSIEMAARSMYSHNECHLKNGSMLQEMMFQKGVNWNDYPVFFKRGTFILRENEERKFTPEEIETLPPQHEARTNPELIITRNVTKIGSPDLTKLEQRQNFLKLVGSYEFRAA